MSRDVLLAVALAAALVGSAVGGGAVAMFGPSDPATPTTPSDPDDGGDGNATDPDRHPDVAQFESRAAFESYLQRASSHRGYAVAASQGGGDGGDAAAERQTVTESAQATSSPDDAGGAVEYEDSGDGGPERVSDTNVQEEGIDEPDVLKTDGRSTFYSMPRGPHDYEKTAVLDTSEPAHPELAATIHRAGKLLLVGDDLVVIGHGAVYGYDVSNRSDPQQKWVRELESDVVTARLIDGDVYLLTRQRADPGEDCRIRVLRDGEGVPCTDVYHPTESANGRTVYTTLSLSPGDGEVSDRVAFLGSRDHAATYVSEESIYLTYDASPDRTTVMIEFLQSSDHLDETARERIDRLESYELSERARRAELHEILRNWRARLDEDERREAHEALEESFADHVKDNRRKLHRSGVVEIGIDGGSLSLEKTGSVPGEPLNQFSLDEHDGKLRIATTVSPFRGRVESTNDLYVLDESLEIAGSVKDMGITERIYSVRFKDDEAYVVTFRQVDPFYVIDLSDQTNPKLRGELKLPGFSRYLHPVSEDRVLGIGEEDGKVKLTLFDTSDPENPSIVESKVLDARFSAVERSHHAFLQDRKHGVFFLPTGEGGHVFSYEGGLEEVKRVDTDGPATRAMYLDDYLYVFGREEVVVVDESDWTTTDEVDL